MFGGGGGQREGRTHEREDSTQEAAHDLFFMPFGTPLTAFTVKYSSVRYRVVLAVALYSFCFNRDQACVAPLAYLCLMEPQAILTLFWHCKNCRGRAHDAPIPKGCTKVPCHGEHRPHSIRPLSLRGWRHQLEAPYPHESRGRALFHRLWGVCWCHGLQLVWFYSFGPLLEPSPNPLNAQSWSRP